MFFQVGHSFFKLPIFWFKIIVLLLLLGTCLFCISQISWYSQSETQIRVVAAWFGLPLWFLITFALLRNHIYCTIFIDGNSCLIKYHAVFFKPKNVLLDQKNIQNIYYESISNDDNYLGHWLVQLRDNSVVELLNEDISTYFPDACNNLVQFLNKWHQRM